VGIQDLNASDPSGWTRTGRNLLFEIKESSYADRVIVALVVGPAAADTRTRLYKGAASRPNVFVGLVKPMGSKYATIFSRELLNALAAKGMDLEQKSAAISAEWAKFVKDDLPLLEQAILEIIKSGPPD
jgi:hypothetical protein